MTKMKRSLQRKIIKEESNPMWAFSSSICQRDPIYELVEFPIRNRNPTHHSPLAAIGLRWVFALRFRPKLGEADGRRASSLHRVAWAAPRGASWRVLERHRLDQGSCEAGGLEMVGGLSASFSLVFSDVFLGVVLFWWLD